jgi:gag-polyprotein putative aspartyl protease
VIEVMSAAHDTQTHKDYVSMANEPREVHVIQTYEEVSDSDSHLHQDDETDLEEWPDSSYGFMSQLADVGDAKHNLEPALLAMGTGQLIVKIRPAKNVSAMIDTGSEICLISKRIHEALGLPLDPAGAAWGIKGINGITENQQGCCRKVPIEIGGLKFDHAFFIKKTGMGNDYDLLMGQSWLNAVAAETLFDNSEDTGPMKIRIFENGNKLGNSAVVNLIVNQRCEVS